MDVWGYINRMILGKKLIANIQWVPIMSVSVWGTGHISQLCEKDADIVPIL